MRILILALSTLLALSAALNSYLYAELELQKAQLNASSNTDDNAILTKPERQQHPLVIAANHAFSQRNTENALLNLSLIATSLPSMLEPLKNQWFDEIKTHVYQHTATQQDNVFVEEYLKAYPYDPYFLYLEIEFAHLKHASAETLLDLFQLQRTPMRADLKSTISQRINEIYRYKTDKLKQLEAWDILAIMLESLLNMAPNNTNIMLDLAQAYAMQEEFNLMEGVLIYLPEDHERVVALREFQSSFNQEKSSDDAYIEPEFTSHPSAVPLKKANSHYIVNALLNERFNAHLMIDTGASTTVISQQVFNALPSSVKPEFIGNYNISTANGLVQSPVYQFNTLSIGDFYVKNIAIVVMPLEHFNADGLLGMNFLRAFRFEIDQGKSELILSPLER